MRYIKDEPYADLFVCDGDLNFHEYYYIEENPQPLQSLVYQVNRTGIEITTPALFRVERSDTTPWCELFAIFSGSGSLHFRGTQYRLHSGQLVILPPGEGHSYDSDPADPLGMTWLEFYGGDSARILTHIADTQGCLLEGSVYARVTAAISHIQQRLMAEKKESIPLKIYEILYILLENETRYTSSGLTDAVRDHLKRTEAYIEAHLGEPLTNASLAQISGLSASYFLAQFGQVYHVSPHQYVMQRRISRAATMLIQTELPVERIAEHLGFCNASHLIRQFQKREHMSPTQYRNRYKIAQ